MNWTILALPALLSVVSGCHTSGGNTPPVPSNPNLPYSFLDPRQVSLFVAYPGVESASASTFWMNSLDLSQRVEYAGGTRVVAKIETGHGWQAIMSVTKIHGSEPSAPSAAQFNTEVVWQKDAASHFKELPSWSEHIALLHPGQYGYQENRDGNPFLGMVVLFDQNPADASKVAGQYHIGFREFFGHYEAENGDIGNKDNYQTYKRWYGQIGTFEP